MATLPRRPRCRAVGGRANAIGRRTRRLIGPRDRARLKPHRRGADTLGILLAIPFAFLLGSFPSGLILGRLLGGRDVRRAGSGNIGAANVARQMGFGIGVAVAVVDILKGMVAVLVGQWTGLGHAGLSVVALAAVLGHDFSIFLHFRGGKGVATTLGVAVVLAPLATVLAAVTWLVVVALWRYASLASLLGLALLPIYVGITGRPAVYVVLASALFLLAAVKHWANIIRLLRGSELPLHRRLADGR